MVHLAHLMHLTILYTFIKINYNISRKQLTSFLLPMKFVDRNPESCWSLSTRVYINPPLKKNFTKSHKILQIAFSPQDKMVPVTWAKSEKVGELRCNQRTNVM